MLILPVTLPLWKVSSNTIFNVILCSSYFMPFHTWVNDKRAQSMLSPTCLLYFPLPWAPLLNITVFHVYRFFLWPTPYPFIQGNKLGNYKMQWNAVSMDSGILYYPFQGLLHFQQYCEQKEWAMWEFGRPVGTVFVKYYGLSFTKPLKLQLYIRWSLKI